MQLRMWMYDLAREQCPTLDHLRRFCDLSLSSGYNAFGLYLEHRFAYPSTPWSHGKGVMTPEMAIALQDEFPELQIIPFINLLGHFEGMMYVEEGSSFAEEGFTGLQACPSNPRFVDLCGRIVDDTLAIFRSNIIHIGGDETAQLGKCPFCAKRVTDWQAAGIDDGKAMLYGEHFGPLSAKVALAGRRPAIWGDMLCEHLSVLKVIPKETIIFDWQYFNRPDVPGQFEANDIVMCPALHTYNAGWLHMPQSERNVRDHHFEAELRERFGVCVTTWECGLFGNYETVLPAIEAAGRILNNTSVGPTIVKPLVEFDRQLDEEKFPGWKRSWEISTIANMIDRRCDTASMQNVASVNEDEYYWVTGKSGTKSNCLGGMSKETSDRYFAVLCYYAGTTVDRIRHGQASTISGKIRGVPFVLDLRRSEDNEYFELSMVPFKNDDFYKALRESSAIEAAYAELSSDHRDWAVLMGTTLQDCGAPFAFSGIRSSVKCRLLLYSNPFLLWLRDRETLCGEPGTKALEILERAIQIAPTTAMRGVSEFVKMAIEFVRHAETAHQAYANHKPGEAIAALTPARQIFDQLANIAKANHLNAGGSLADIERCRAAKEHVEKVILRVKQYGDGSLGYLPSFEIITHPKFMPHDQGNWWLINKWANE